MGLNISHGTWDGAYSAFMTWRRKIAEVAGLPPLDLMEGFYDPIDNARLIPTLYPGIVPEYSFTLKELDKRLPIRWSCLKPSPLHELLYHSDCDGHLNWTQCRKIANELEKLLPLLPKENAGGHIGDWTAKTKQFITGLRLAYERKERLKFR